MRSETTQTAPTSPLGSSGWRYTQTLKCEACGEQTRDAEILTADSPWANSDEEQQRIALGDPDSSQYGHLTDLERVRREYREIPFPRNPSLNHRFYTEAATKAWDDGTQATTLCGELKTVHRDPRTWNQSESKQQWRDERCDGFNVAEQLGDTEYEDTETGWWWVDMDCVDCCRVGVQRPAAAEATRAPGAVSDALCGQPRIGARHRRR